MLDDYDEEQFISGIYNYCDRWCKRCKMTRYCLLYHQESKLLAENIKQGEVKDDRDRDTVLQDIKNEFKKIIEMLNKIAQEEGIDLDSIDVKSVSRAKLSEHPLHLKAREYTKAVHDFLDKLGSVINGEFEEVSTDTVAFFIKGTETIEKLSECYEVINWYHIFISAKIHRALSSKMKAEAQENEELAAYSWDDANGSAKVAHEALVKSMNALTIIYKWNESLHDDITPLLFNIYGLIKGIEKEFPRHKEFIRHGLDD